MTLSELLAALRTAGVRLSVRGGGLHFRAPKGAYTPALRRGVTAHRDDLLHLFSPCPECGRPLDEGRCWRCHYRRCDCGRNTGSAAAFGLPHVLHGGRRAALSGAAAPCRCAAGQPFPRRPWAVDQVVVQPLGPTAATVAVHNSRRWPAP